MKRIATALLFLLAPLGTAAAQTPPPPSVYGSTQPGHESHDGFYARGFLGVNGTSMTAKDTEVSGAGGTVGLAAGWAIVPNLIVYGEIFGDMAVNPSVKFGNIEFETSDTSAGVVGFGLGGAYYFMPVNLYVSLTLATSQLTVSHKDEEVGSSELGFGASLMVGKEWWVTSNWGCGVALQVYGGTMKDNAHDETTWTTAAAAVVFSATYN